MSMSESSLEFLKKTYREGLEQPLEMCLNAVQFDGFLLQYIKNQTPEICITALTQNYKAFSLVEIKMIPLIMKFIAENNKLYNYVIHIIIQYDEGKILFDKLNEYRTIYARNHLLLDDTEPVDIIKLMKLNDFKCIYNSYEYLTKLLNIINKTDIITFFPMDFDFHKITPVKDYLETKLLTEVEYKINCCVYKPINIHIIMKNKTHVSINHHKNLYNIHCETYEMFFSWIDDLKYTYTLDGIIKKLKKYTDLEFCV